MKKFTAFLTLLVLLAAPALFAQSFVVPINRPDTVRTVSLFGDDDDSNGSPPPILWVKYVGAEESGTVDLNSNAIEFFSGDLGSEVIDGDTGYDVNTGDVCGTTNDSLDVTDAECDTPAELCNVINDSGANWVCAVANVLGTETLATAAEYVDMADAQAKVPGGLGIFIDQTDVDTLALLMRPDANRSVRPNTNEASLGDIEFFLNPPAGGSYAQTLRDNPFGNQRFALTNLVLEADTTGVWTISIYARRYQPDGRVSDRIIYQRADLTADASTENEFDFLGKAPLITQPGETVLIKILDDALVTGRISATGFFFTE